MPDYIPPPSTLKPGSLVWAYLRDSGGDGQEKSIPQQEAEISAYCGRHGLILTHAFKDEAKSGGSVTNRDAFLDMVDLAGKPDHRPAGLLLWNFARFARDLDDSSYYKAALRKFGLIVHSLTDPIPEGTYGRMIETLIDIANEEKRRQNSRDVKRSLQALFRQGYSFGTPPKGFITRHEVTGKKRDGQDRRGGKWIPDPALWDLVKLAWALRAEGKTYGEIRERTHGLIYTSKACWKGFFSNKAYLGIGVWGDLEIPDHHEAAIDLETWELVQTHQAQTRRPTGGLHHPRTIGTPHLLTGLAYCAVCGAAMVKDRMHGWDCYLCGTKRRNGAASCEARMIGSKKADAAIYDATVNRILTPDFATALLSETQKVLNNTTDLDKEKARLEKSLVEINKAISNLLDLAEKAGASAALDRLKEREAERARLALAIRQAEAKQQAAQVELTPEALALALEAWRGDLVNEYKMGNTRAAKALITRFVTRIELGYNQATINYSFPFNALYSGNSVIPLGGTNNLGELLRDFCFKHHNQ